MNLEFSSSRIFCPLCGSDKSQFYNYAKYQNLKVSYDLCLNCHSIFQNPPLTKETLNDIYNDPLYWKPSKGKVYQRYTGYLDQERQYIYEFGRRLKLILRVLKCQDLYKKNVMDIGCGPCYAAPAFLKAKANYLGVEPSSEMANVAKDRFGANVMVGMFEDLGLSPNSYDLVVAWGTSMLFSKPGVAYSKICSILKPGGSLFFDFFDMGGLFSFLTYKKRRKVIHPSHAPSKKGFEILLPKAGFDKIKFHRHFPYFSLPMIVTQFEILFLKKLVSFPPFDKLGVLSPIPGTYIIQAIKKEEFF